jgi:hypothetical protein
VHIIPPNTLRARLKGRQSITELRNPGYKLSEFQENVLIGWIVSLDVRGAAPKRYRVREMAEIILQQNSTLSPHVGKNWVTEFTKRRPEIKSRFARKISRQRALCEDPKVISPFFEKLQRFKNEHRILDEDIYNFDETGFAMGLIASTKLYQELKCLPDHGLLCQGIGNGLPPLNASIQLGGQCQPPSSSKESAI